jgi:hypothetical protein
LSFSVVCPNPVLFVSRKRRCTTIGLGRTDSFRKLNSLLTLHLTTITRQLVFESVLPALRQHLDPLGWPLKTDNVRPRIVIVRSACLPVHELFPVPPSFLHVHFSPLQNIAPFLVRLAPLSNSSTWLAVKRDAVTHRVPTRAARRRPRASNHISNARQLIVSREHRVFCSLRKHA